MHDNPKPPMPIRNKLMTNADRHFEVNGKWVSENEEKRKKPIASTQELGSLLNGYIENLPKSSIPEATHGMVFNPGTPNNPGQHLRLEINTKEQNQDIDLIRSELKNIGIKSEYIAADRSTGRAILKFTADPGKMPTENQLIEAVDKINKGLYESKIQGKKTETAVTTALPLPPPVAIKKVQEETLASPTPIRNILAMKADRHFEVNGKWVSENEEKRKRPIASTQELGSLLNSYIENLPKSNVKEATHGIVFNSGTPNNPGQHLRLEIDTKGKNQDIDLIRYELKKIGIKSEYIAADRSTGRAILKFTTDPGKMPTENQLIEAVDQINKGLYESKIQGKKTETAAQTSSSHVQNNFQDKELARRNSSNGSSRTNQNQR